MGYKEGDIVKAKIRGRYYDVKLVKEFREGWRVSHDGRLVMLKHAVLGEKVKT